MQRHCLHCHNFPGILLCSLEMFLDQIPSFKVQGSGFWERFNLSFVPVNPASLPAAITLTCDPFQHISPPSLSLQSCTGTETRRKRKRELSLNQTLALELQALKVVCRGVLILFLANAHAYISHHPFADSLMWTDQTRAFHS
jgi:hypothetical protein